MKRMMMAGLVFVAVSSAGAQGAKPAAPAKAPKAAAAAKDELSGEMAEHFKGITLTAEQKAKIIAINKSRHAAMDKMAKEGKPADPKDTTAMKAMKGMMQKEMDAEHAEFKAVLTPEQYKIFTANMSKMDMSKMDMGKMKEGMKGMDHEMSGMKHDMGEKKDTTKSAKALPKKP